MSRCLGILLVVIFAGCGGGPTYTGEERVPVRGTISLNGQPIAKGTIFFEGQRRSGAAIVNGEYSVEEIHGPNTGVNQVHFSVLKSTGEFEPAEDGELDEVFEEVLPKKFRRDTGIEVTFESGEQGRFDFDIVTE